MITNKDECIVLKVATLEGDTSLVDLLDCSVHTFSKLLYETHGQLALIIRH